MSTLIAEDLLLVLLDDDEGRVDLGMRPKLDAGLAAAVLAELALDGVVSITDAHGMFHPAEVRVDDADSVADPVLRDALSVIAEKDRSAETLVGKLGHGLRGRLLERLAEAGMIERTQDSFLIVFDRTRWPAADAAHENEVKQTLRAALVDGAHPDPRAAVLIALLAELGQAHKVVPHEGVADDVVNKRAAELAEGGWATEGLRKALQAATVGALAGAGVI